MAISTVTNMITPSNAARLRTGALEKQRIYTIHTDVQTAWRRRVCNVQLIPGFFTDRATATATAMLATVRRTNPRAFIKTKLAYIA